MKVIKKAKNNTFLNSILYSSILTSNSSPLFAFGTILDNRNFGNSPRVGFNGKEKDDEIKGIGNSLDFGARIYDSRLGRWLAVDPLAIKYSNLSTYNFAGNTPIQANDPDGRLIIFINGYYGFPTAAHSGGKRDHWENSNKTWIENTKSNLNDYKAYYFDGSLGGVAAYPANLSKDVRKTVGYIEGRKNARSILENLDAGETVKFVTSSMGAAYQRGFSQALVDEADAMNKEIDKYNEAATEHNNKIDALLKDEKDITKIVALNASRKELKQKIDLKIEVVVDLDAFQGDQIPADPNAEKSYYGLNYGIDIEKKEARTLGVLEDLFVGDRVPGSKEIGKGTMDGHHPSFFPTKNFIGLTSPSTGTPKDSPNAKDHENPR